MKKISIVFMTLFFALILTACLNNEDGPKGNYNVIFMVDNEVYHQTKADSENELVLPDSPSKENYIFNGWLYDGSIINNTFVVTGHTVLIADFRLDQINAVTISFMVDNELYENIEGASGSNIDYPENPSGTSTFIGWFDGFGNPFNEDIFPNSNIVLYAKFERVITISFYANNILYETIQVEVGKPIEYPNDPETEYTFIGWYTSNDVLFEEINAPNNHLSLYAKFDYNVLLTFFVEDEVYHEITGLEGSQFTYPSQPVKDGYNFIGWFTEDNVLFNSNEIPNGNTKLYAKFNDPVTINFYVDGTIYQTINTSSGEWFSYPDDPTSPVNNMYFNGWYTADNILFEEHTVVSNLNLYAKFIEQFENERLIEFYQGSTLLHSQLVPVGSKFDPKVVARQAGYNFKNWYTDSNLTTLFNINSKINNNIVLYGDWYNLNVDFGGYYKNLPYGLSGNTLRDAIHTIIDLPYSSLPTYGEARYAFATLDKDPNKPNNVIHIYTGLSQTGVWGQGVKWDREHVVPQSKLPDGASNGTRNSASDLFNLKPLESSVNSSRGNKPFMPGSGTYGAVSGGYYPGDDWIGDVARIVMYMLVQYPSVKQSEVIGSYALALEWIQKDPVDTFEANRNNLIHQLYQPNRNPFVDLPYLAYNIWGNI